MPMTIHGTLDEQLDRCDQEIARCEAYLSNHDNPDRFGAELGLLDCLVNRQDILTELARRAQLEEQGGSGVELI